MIHLPKRVRYQSVMLERLPLEVSLGATYLGNGRCLFRVWAPLARRVDLHLVASLEKLVPLEAMAKGYFEGVFDDIAPGALYFYRLDDREEHPDPASRFQPEGVHGPSAVVDPEFLWEDRSWTGLPLQDYVIYEVHVGTFTTAGTFESMIPQLDGLRDLGITAVELMPVAQFPGSRNWGYDGVYPFAVQNSYGGPTGLKKLVNACHLRGMSVVLDVVYNHLGPEGNYLGNFGRYFTSRYQTPWGHAMNFDGPGSDEVRLFFIQNAIYWLSECHVDALRLDAVHAILDFSAHPFLEELSLAVAERFEGASRRVHLIAESALNDTRILKPPEFGGFNLDAQWNDDFHHALHTVLTGENEGYYQDFGHIQDLVKAMKDGFVYSGEYSPFRGRRFGSASHEMAPYRLVVFSQNHDQVGNRMTGDRLSRIVPFEALKLAAGVVLVSPCIPLLFMGEEYGETADFPYFISHRDPELVEAVRKGRREEFAGFQWQGEPPDPQDETTFQSAKLNRALMEKTPHSGLYRLYRELIALRRSLPSLRRMARQEMAVWGSETSRLFFIHRWSHGEEALAVFNFGNDRQEVELEMGGGPWEPRLCSADEKWGGPGADLPSPLGGGGALRFALSPLSFALLVR